MIYRVYVQYTCTYAKKQHTYICVSCNHKKQKPSLDKKTDNKKDVIKLKVIYDAAHCFGVTYKNKSIFEYGDASTCSFHATKIFHTGEGGAIFTTHKDLQHQFFYSHNFGHNGPLDFHGLGINAKISELQAAMGLCVMEHLPEIFESRKKIIEYYNANLNFDNNPCALI